MFRVINPKINLKRYYSNKTTKQTRRIGLKTTLALLVPYTGYAIYVFGKTNYEITKRDRELEDQDDLAFETTLFKYSPLKILGRFENPFNEYRIQTVYEFFFNRLIEVFQLNRGGLPRSKAKMDELMPIHKPLWLMHGDDEIMSKDTKNDISVELKPFSTDNAIVGEVSSIQLNFTWLGQSCSLILLDNLKILTDPLFSNHLISETIGPKRITDMPCEIEDMPTPDIILVSHNHPDHLDEKSLQFWGDSSPQKPLWIVPKGLASYMFSNNVSNFIELSWWETCHVKLKNPNNQSNGETVYQISSVPAMHWSGRSVLDANRSLWCSFFVHKGPKPVLFHAGDTGFVHDLYKRMAQKYGEGVTLALLPCGQYCPEWHQRPRHINPQEVIKIMKDLNAQNTLGIHWGTFILSGEYFREPKEKLEMMAGFDEISDRCYCPELGQTIDFSEKK